MLRPLSAWTLACASLALAQDLAPGKPRTVVGYVHEKGDNPSGLMPTHQEVSFGPGGSLDVVPIAEWEKAFQAEPEVGRGCVTAPVAALRRLVGSKDQPSPKQQMPIVGCVDASVHFTLHVRRVRFAGGVGFLFVTQQFIESVSASNEGLVAMFQGLSDDGRTWVGGTFRLKAKGLREGSVDLTRDPDAYEKAIAADAAMLSALGSADFDPHLDAVAAAIGNLELPPPQRY